MAAAPVGQGIQTSALAEACLSFRLQEMQEKLNESGQQNEKLHAGLVEASKVSPVLGGETMLVTDFPLNKTGNRGAQATS